MAEGIFTIDEFMADGREIRRFTWTADTTPVNLSEGGAKACPLKGWAQPSKLRTKRTDYPGSDGDPSEQVLGFNHDPFTLRGRWDDRHNFAGYAIKELFRFEEMVARGRPVRIQYQSMTFIGLITNLVPDYRLEWYIRYEFTFSVHRRGDVSAAAGLKSTPSAVPPVASSVDDIEAHALAMEELDVFRPALLVGELGDTVSAGLADISSTLGQLQATLDQNQIDVIVDDTITPFRRIATQMRSVRGAALDNVANLSAVRADVDLAIKDANNMLSFEVWSRGLREVGRRLAGVSYQAALDVEERDTPAAETLYRPKAGESLYRIANRFYGNADAWRLIAERNNLRTITLDGTEVLVIPARGQG